MTLGTSDSTGATSLAGVDLYDDTFGRLATIEARQPHAVEFWRRIGYQIVGVLPDAEGPASRASAWPGDCSARGAAQLRPVRRTVLGIDAFSGSRLSSRRPGVRVDSWLGSGLPQALHKLGHRRPDLRRQALEAIAVSSDYA